MTQSIPKMVLIVSVACGAGIVVFSPWRPPSVPEAQKLPSGIESGPNENGAFRSRIVPAYGDELPLAGKPPGIAQIGNGLLTPIKGPPPFATPVRIKPDSLTPQFVDSLANLFVIALLTRLQGPSATGFVQISEWGASTAADFIRDLMSAVLRASGLLLSKQQLALRGIQREVKFSSAFFVWAGPNWLRHLLNEEQKRAFCDVSQISLENSQVNERAFVYLAQLPRLEFLSLNNTDVVDAELAHVKSLPSLRYLLLNDTRVTDAGLAYLKGLKKLEYLSLRKSQVTDAGVAELRRALPNTDIY